MDSVDCVVIGAGVVGLAIARALARSGREVVIIEKETLIGSGISSRNSEVIHAGIYYPKNSLKARLSVAGNRRLYDYCRSRNVPYHRCGKLIAASSQAQIAELARLASAANANGVHDLEYLDGAQARRLEPEIHALAALFSPSTGIVDSHQFMLSLLGEAEEAGAMAAYVTHVDALASDGENVCVWTNGETEPALQARLVVNAAGLSAVAVALNIRDFPRAHIPQMWLAKGSYFSLRGRARFRHLVYPVPEPGGLGVHLTLDMGGQARFGPDVEWIDAVNFDVDVARAEKFYGAIRAYWPNLPDGALEPAYVGIRPKLSPPGAPAADFYIGGPERHGIAGIVNLFGIESPGLTASLAIADEVLRLIGEAADG